METTNGKPTAFAFGKIPDLKGHLREKKLALWIGLALIGVVSLGAVGWMFWSIQAKEREFEASLENRLELIARGRVDVISTWLSGVARQGDRIIRADLFRLYASEIDLIEGDISYLLTGIGAPPPVGGGETAQLAAQLPMMEKLLVDFVRYSGFLSGRVINRSGQAFIATDGRNVALQPEQRKLAEQVFAKPETLYSPVRNSPNGLVLDICLPIFPPEAAERGDAPVAVLLLSKAVSDKINELLTPSPQADRGERTRLVQRAGADYQEVVPWLPEPLQPLKPGILPEEAESLPFAERVSLFSDQKVYSVGYRVPELEWWVVEEADYQTARQVLRNHARAVTSIAGLLILIFGTAFGAAWALFVGRENRRTAEYFETLAEQIEEQRQFLDGVNNTIGEFIGLKDLRGVYTYANPAFARAVGRTPEEMINLDDTAIFGFDTAKRLEHSDQAVLAHGEPMTLEEEVYLQSRKCYLQISKVPFIDKSGRISGVVSVFRDVTAIIEVQRRHEKAILQTIEALARAVELVDPYLSGHSQLMSEISVEVAKVVNAEATDIATVEIAANLSQIGKMYVDRQLLAKSGPLTAEEKREMERHVEHAGEILAEIDFDLPIFEAVTQMNECLDGSGYPRGLKGDQIGLSARILAVTNSFCAMVKPRAYRGARSIEETLAILDGSGELYDLEVVRALKEVVHSPVGEKILSRAAD